MHYQLLGSTGLRVSELALGTMRLLTSATPTSEEEQVVAGFLEAGGNLVDTAPMYGNGEAERRLGRMLVGRRDRVVLSTKFTPTRDASDPNGAGSHRKNLRLSLESSLRNLRTDHIDVYWVHLWDPRTPIDETLRVLDDAVTAGQVLYVGISNAPAYVVAIGVCLARSAGQVPFAAIQVPYNLLQRDVERELLPMAEHLGLSVTTWSPLAKGRLAGEASPTDADNARVLHVLDEVAREVGQPVSRVAIAWLCARSPRIVPILGPRTREHLEDGLAALQVPLSSDQVRRLAEARSFELGYPRDFLDDVEEQVFGLAATNVTGTRRQPWLGSV